MTMSRAPLPLPETLGSGPFHLSDAHQLGVTEGRLNGADLIVPFRGVRAIQPPQSVVDRARALLPVLPAGAVLSHTTAGQLRELPLPARCEDPAAPLHVCTPRQTPAIRRAGVIGHRGAELRTRTSACGLPITCDADIWLDLAPDLTLDDLVALGDAIIYRDPHALDEITQLVRGSRGIRGVLRAREALALMRLRCASPRETRVRLLILRSDLPAPELNADVHDAFGSWLANVDFFWRLQRLIVEYDGEIHAAPGHREHDAQRRRRLTANGYDVIVLTKADIPAREAEVMAEIRHLLSL